MVMTEVIVKVNRILEGFMKCRLEFQEARTLTSDLWYSKDLEMLRSSIGQRPQYIVSLASGSFGFPITVGGVFAGLAVVKGWQGARPDQLILLAELLASVLESGLSRHERIEELRTLEERMTLMTGVSNVIPLRPINRLTASELLEKIEQEPMTVAPSSPLTTKPLLIEARAEFPLQRVAVEVHQLASRWAFVCLEDLPSDILSSRESLKELGAVTVFIKDISVLSTEQQLKLAEYLSTEPAGDMPHIIAGTPTAPKILEVEGRVLGHLIELFCVLQLQGNAAKDEEVTSELIKSSLRKLIEQAQGESHKIGNHYVPFHIQYFNPDHPTMH